jgi:hypothetical protein
MIKIIILLKKTICINEKINYANNVICNEINIIFAFINNVVKHRIYGFIQFMG